MLHLLLAGCVAIACPSHHSSIPHSTPTADSNVKCQFWSPLDLGLGLGDACSPSYNEKMLGNHGDIPNTSTMVKNRDADVMLPQFLLLTLPYYSLPLFFIINLVVGVTHPTLADPIVTPAFPLLPTSPLRLAVFDWDADVTANVQPSSFPLRSSDLVNVTMWGPPGFALSITINFFIAIQHFNDRRADVLPALAHLTNCPRNISTYRFCETAGVSSLAVKGAQSRMLVNTPPHVLVGFASSDSARAVSVIGSTQCEPYSQSTAVMSHWSSATDLKDKSKYPLFSRTFPSDYELARSVSAYTAQLNFKTVAVLFIDGDSGPTFAQDLTNTLNTFNVTTITVPFDINMPQGISMLKSLQAIQQEQVNVVICVLYVQYFSEVAKQAKVLNFGLDGDVQWIFTFADRDPAQSDIDDDPALARLLQGSMLLKLSANGEDVNSLFANYTKMWPSFQNDTNLINLIQTVFPPHGDSLLSGNCDAETFDSLGVFDQYDPVGYFPSTQSLSYELWAFTYDAVMALGIASCGGLDAPSVPSSLDNATKLFEAIGQVDFEGLSGRVRFNEAGDRHPDTVNVGLYNMLTTNNVFVFRRVGEWNQVQSRIDYIVPVSSLMFKNGAGLGGVPIDRTIIVHDKSYLPQGLREFAYAQVALMLLISVVVWIWLLANRHHKVLVNAQWSLAQFVILGCAVLSVSLMAHVGSTDDNTPSNTLDPSISCEAQIALYLGGMEIAMLALMAKSTRLYSVVHNTKLKRRAVRLRIINVVLVFVVLFEVAVFVEWGYVAPVEFKRVIVYETRGQPTLSKGYCDYGGNGGVPFLILVLILHSFTLLGMGYSAHLVKNLPSEYQESKHIFYAIYVMVEIYFVALPTYAALLNEVIGRFVVWNVMVVVSWAVLGGYTFFPKWYLMTYGTELFAATDMQQASTPPVQ